MAKSGGFRTPLWVGVLGFGLLLIVLLFRFFGVAREPRIAPATEPRKTAVASPSERASTERPRDSSSVLASPSPLPGPSSLTPPGSDAPTGRIVGAYRAAVKSAAPRAQLVAVAASGAIVKAHLTEPDVEFVWDRIPSGRYRIVAVPADPRSGPSVIDVAVRPGEDARADLLSVAGESLVGSVRDSRGGAAKGVRVRGTIALGFRSELSAGSRDTTFNSPTARVENLSSSWSLNGATGELTRTVYTDPSGKFEISGLPSQRTVEVAVDVTPYESVKQTLMPGGPAVLFIPK